MNGLEAIEFMKQGKMVVSKYGIVSKHGDDVVINKIVDGDVCYMYKHLKDGSEWEIDDCFDFTKTYEEYVEPKQLTGWERVGENESYYHISCNCYVEKLIEERCMEDKYYYEDANYFSTEEKAEEINFKQTLFRKLQRFSDENWDDNNQTKYCIVYDHSNQKIVVEVAIVSRTQLGQVYFSSFKTTQKAIELFHDDLIKYFTM